MNKLLKYVFIVLILSLLITGFLHPINAFTQDLGRHLLTGKIILHTHQVPLTNLYSYTFPNFPFINTHWLSEVLFYLTTQTVGANGLLVITTLIVLIAYGLLLRETIRHNLFAISIISLLYLPILFERTDVRPEFFSFLFLSIFILILYRYSQRFTKLIFLLPFLELLWVNMHIYYFVGLGVIGIFLIDQIVKLLHCFIAKKQSSNKRAPASNNRAILYLLIVLLLSFAATLFNPNQVSGALYPLRVFQNYGYSIEENQNIFFLQSLIQNRSILFFELSVVLLFLSLALTFKKTKPIDLLLAIAFTVLGASAVRNLPLFVFATFIPFAKSLSIIFDVITQNICKVTPSQRCNLFKGAVYFLLLSAFFFQFKFVLNQKPVGFGITKGAENAADFLIANNLKGPIFNNFDIGSFLEYRIYPEKVFVDGRPESYPADFFQKIYIPMQQDPNTFTAIDHRYNFNTIFFAHTDQTPWAETFLKSITQNKDWQIVYLDDYVIILVKRTTENLSLITKYGMSLDGLKISNVGYANKISLYRLASFFSKLGLTNDLKSVDEKILSLDSNNCPALQSYAAILSQEKNPGAVIYMQRFQNNCQ